MNEIVFVVGDLPVRLGAALVGFGAAALLLLLVITIVIARSGRRGAELALEQAVRADELELRTLVAERVVHGIGRGGRGGGGGCLREG